MSKIDIDKDNDLLTDDDAEYEKGLADIERERQRAVEEAEKKALEEREEQERIDRKRREQQNARDRIELMKLKSGVIEESETIKEEHAEKRVLTRKEKISNFWYHNKFMILFFGFIFAVIAYITISELLRVRPDITVMMIADNGLQYRQEELENFFEKYVDDLNDDGKVKVSVMIIPLNNNNLNDQGQQANQTKFMAQIQIPDNIMVLTDSNIEKGLVEIFKKDLSKDFPGNKYIDEMGLSLNFGFLAQDLKFENMPYDIHLSLREPTETFRDKKEVMDENYRTAFVIFKRITEDLTKRAEELNDQGLTTAPVKIEQKELDPKNVHLE